MVDLKLCNLVVLVRRHTNESALDQVMDEDWLLVFLGYEPGDDHPRLVLVHGVQCHHLQQHRDSITPLHTVLS